LVGEGRHKIGSLPPRATLRLKLVRNPNTKCELNGQETVRELKKDIHVADSNSSKSDQIVAEQREIQRVVDTESENGAASSSGATQAGARRYPEPPFPKQHQPKPGEEAQLDPAPMYDAPYYRGSGKLQDKVAIVTGGDSGIGRSVAVLFAREGADVVTVYLAEHEDARGTKAAVEKEGRRCLLISGDVRVRSFCRAAVAQTLREFGRLDVLVNNAAFQIHTARFEDLT
jgi:hypothetical protein